MSAAPKTIIVQGAGNCPQVAVEEPLGCCGGSSTYHVARAHGGKREIAPGETWRPLCGLARVSNGATFTGREAEKHLQRFRLCRACVAALEGGGA